jgi:hypothetical protein
MAGELRDSAARAVAMISSRLYCEVLAAVQDILSIISAEIEMIKWGFPEKEALLMKDFFLP